MTYKDFVATASKTYFKWRDNYYEDFGCEDWEQHFFDELENKLNTKTEYVLVHLFYDTDEGNTEVAQGILNDLLGKELVSATCFEDTDYGTTVAVMLVKRQGA